MYGPSLDAMVRAKKLERDALNAELDQLQQQLDQLTQAVGDFDSQFKRRVGVLYVELLNLKALYWRERWGFDPSLEMILKEFYQEARQRQREIYGNAYDADDSMWTDWESFKAGKGSSESHPPSNWEEELKRRNDPQLKEIRRRIAKQISPDYVMATADPELIQRYTELMQRVNTAVEAGDLVTLERIEAQLFGFLDEDVSPSLRMQLQRLLKEIATLREHIIQVEQEIKQQQLSDSYQLLQNLQQCGESVEAFLSRQAENVTAEIEIVNEQIKQFRKQKNAKAQGETP